MNCNAVPLQSPASHSARWVRMDNKSRTPTGFHIESYKFRRDPTEQPRSNRGVMPLLQLETIALRQNIGVMGDVMF